MRVLILTRNAWDDTNSVGNTMSNFFCDQQDVELANLYFRSAMPNNAVCTRYYHVTETELLKRFFFPAKCGHAFSYHPNKQKEKTYSNEKKLISVIHRFGLRSALRLSDSLWDSKKWINERFRSFIEGFQPDVVFSFAKASPQYYHTIRFLYEEYHIKVMLWIGDDEYSALKISNRKKDKERIERLRYILDRASVVWGCSEEICEYYNRVFGCKATPLYKKCSFEYPVREKVDRPLRLVYAGNLLFGRDEILKTIIRQLSELNRETPLARLDIYSSTPVSDKELGQLDVPGVSSFCWARPYAEIKKLMSQADAILLAESFDENEIIKTRYSFSTKIIDCLQSGSALIAIGPPDIASIRYIGRIPGAYVIDDEKEIRSGISDVIAHSDELPRRAAQIRQFAVEHHSQDREWLKTVIE